MSSKIKASKGAKRGDDALRQDIREAVMRAAIGGTADTAGVHDVQLMRGKVVLLRCVGVTVKQEMAAVLSSVQLGLAQVSLDGKLVSVRKQDAVTKEREAIHCRCFAAEKGQAVTVSAHGADAQLRKPLTQMGEIRKTVTEKEHIRYIRVAAYNIDQPFIATVGIRADEKAHTWSPLTEIWGAHILKARSKKRGVFMKFDPKAMQALLSLDDDALWAKIRALAAASGVALASEVPPAADLKKLRAVLGGCGQTELNEALETIARFRKGK